MKKKTLTSTISIYEVFEELPQEIQSLFKEAEKARDKAYAPYSNYLVGAALLLESGKIVTGSNQENAAYPSGLCAERTALFYAGAKYPDEVIKAIAITVKSVHQKVDSPAPPCGACRQSISEYEFKQNANIALYFRGEAGETYKADSLLAILPLAFNKNFL